MAGRAVRLTAIEYELLRLLTLNAGRVSTYESLIRRLWSGPDGGDAHLARHPRSPKPDPAGSAGTFIRTERSCHQSG